MSLLLHTAALLLLIIAPLNWSALTSLFLWSHTAVAVIGQGPGWRADAVVGPQSVYTVAVFTVGWVLALIHVCTTKRQIQCSRWFSQQLDNCRLLVVKRRTYQFSHLLLLSSHTSSCWYQESRGCCSCSRRTLWCWRTDRWYTGTHRDIHSHLEGEQATGISYEAKNKTAIALFDLCISILTDALQKVAVVVEALLTVAFVAWLRVFTAALLADFISKQRTLVNICRQRRGKQLTQKRR